MASTAAPGSVLKKFDVYCTPTPAVFDRDTIEGWVTEQLADRPYRSWMSYIRDVAGGCRSTGTRTHVCLTGGRPGRAPRPTC